MRSPWSVLLAAPWLLVGCGGEDSGGTGSGPPDPPPEVGECAPGESAVAPGDCLAAGMQANGCPAGELGIEGGGCQPAGIPPDACANGFASDGDGGCVAILPAMACAPGLIAVPGDATCRELSACGSGTWGDIARKAGTQHVDAAYAGGGSDGSASKPWTMVQQGIDAAAPGATVAIAAGSYVEDLIVEGAAVVLRGICASRVEIVGSSTAPAAIQIGAALVELHDLAVRGEAGGVSIRDAEDVLVDRVWIHDTMGTGIQVTDEAGPAGVTVTGALLEQTSNNALHVAGAKATVEGSALRATQPAMDQTGGRGVRIEGGARGARASVTIRGALLDENLEVGLYVKGSDANVESTVVRATAPSALGLAGRGVNVQDDSAAGERGSVTLRGSLVLGNHDLGIFAGGSDLTIDATVISDTAQGTTGDAGWGLAVQHNPMSGEPADVQVHASLFDRNRGVGVVSVASKVALTGVLVRDTQPDATGIGRALNVQPDIASGARASATVVGCVLERSRDTGVFVVGSDATLEGTVVRDVEGSAPDRGGRGISAEAYPGGRATLALRASVVERAAGLGVLVSGSDATLEGSAILDSIPEADGWFGNGMVVQFDPDSIAPSTAVIRSSVFDRSYDLGVFVHGSEVDFDATLVRDTKPSQVDGLFGDGVAVVGGGAHVRMTRSRVETAARAGLASFGAHVELESSTFACNGIDLDGETLEGSPSSFEDLGDNACGCPAADTCSVKTANLAPPAALP